MTQEADIQTYRDFLKEASRPTSPIDSRFENDKDYKAFKKLQVKAREFMAGTSYKERSSSGLFILDYHISWYARGGGAQSLHASDITVSMSPKGAKDVVEKAVMADVNEFLNGGGADRQGKLPALIAKGATYAAHIAKFKEFINKVDALSKKTKMDLMDLL